MKFGTRHHGSPPPEYDCTTLVFRTKIGLSHEKSIINYTEGFNKRIPSTM
jgi:hypothetical protein